MKTLFRNEVAAAIDGCGGPTKAAKLLGVSTTTVHNWIRNRRVPDIDRARKLAGLVGTSHQVLRRLKS